MVSAPVTFHPLRRQDFPLIAGWLAEPLVARWWNHETSPEAVERDFGPSVDGRDATEMFLATASAGAGAGAADDQPFGLIQRYPIDAYPEYVEELAPVCEVPPGALSVDYLIGDPAMRGRGLGTVMIAEMVLDSWARHPEANDVIVPVAAGNSASWRSLEAAGFHRIAEGHLKPDNPIDPTDHHIYQISRPSTG